MSQTEEDALLTIDATYYLGGGGVVLYIQVLCYYKLGGASIPPRLWIGYGLEPEIQEFPLWDQVCSYGANEQ